MLRRTATRVREKARKVDADSDSDAIPRYLRPDRVGRPLADYAPGYEMVAHKIQKDAMRAIGTVWGPEGRLQCLGSAAHDGIRLRGGWHAHG